MSGREPDTTVIAGFQSIGMHLTGAERERLLIALHYACLQLEPTCLTGVNCH